MLRSCWAMALSCALGCGEDQWDDVGPALSIGELTGGGEEDLSHGSFGVRFALAENVPASVFFGTAEIEVTARYDECFASFYDEHPEYTIEGPMAAQVYGTLDDGGEGWFDRLCDPAQDELIDCSVTAIEQEVQVAEWLRVRYAVSGTIEGRDLDVGPFPLNTEILDFPCDGPPRLQLTPAEIIGRDAMDATLWVGTALDHDMPAPLQASPVVVQVGPP